MCVRACEGVCVWGMAGLMEMGEKTSVLQLLKDVQAGKPLFSISPDFLLSSEIDRLV